MALTKIADAGLKTPASDLQDNEKIILGTGNDLSFYHDGTHSYIENTNGSLKFAAGQVEINKSTAETMAKFVPDAQVELYHDNSKKLQTESWGIDVSGTVQCDQLTLLDNEQIRLGTGTDLKIYHDGSNSYIQDDGTGELRLRGTTVRITDHDGSENFANFNDDGACELFYDNSKKLATSGSGVEIENGDLRVHLDLKILSDNRKAIFGAGGDLEIYHTGTLSRIDNNTGDLLIRTNVDSDVGGNIYLKPHDDEDGIIIFHDGAVELYNDNSLKAQTTSTGFIVYGNLHMNGDDRTIKLGAGDDYQVWHNGTHTYRKNITGTLHDWADNWKVMSVDDNETMLTATEHGAVSLYYDNSEKIRTTSTGFKTLGNAQFDDNRKAEFGDAQDLQIYHDGTSSFIDTATSHDLYIRNTQGNQIRLQPRSGEDGVKIIADDAVELYCDNARKLETTPNGITVTGSVTETSDETLKENIVTLTNAVDTIKQIKGVSFNWKDAAYGGKAIGVIAQDVEKVYPDLVIDREDKETKVTTKTLNYAGLIGPLVECIKELDTRIKTLEAA